MNIPVLLIGVMIGFGVFAAAFWSLWQAIITHGWQRYAFAAAAALTLIGMATISLVAPVAALIVGITLTVTCCGTIYAAQRWSKILPALQIIFAVCLVAGLPFAG